MRADHCQSSKVEGAEPVKSPKGTVTSVPPVHVGGVPVPPLQKDAVFPLGVPVGTNLRRAPTCGLLPTVLWRIARPASVGAPLSVLPAPKALWVHFCADTKKNVWSFQIGPPKVPPSWFSTFLGDRVNVFFSGCFALLARWRWGSRKPNRGNRSVPSWVLRSRTIQRN